ncbi:MAG: ATP-binding cassette domain-containing protein [Acidobacteriia bacterium]|nr:ATP-binding cassette domain-containing protein [Terriglobia bacterium]
MQFIGAPLQDCGEEKADLAFIEIEGLTKKYSEDVYALRSFSLAVEKGEWLAVMGPSGSGKSTLLNILGCLDSPTEGRVVVEGENLGRLGRADLARFRAEKVGFIFQQFHLVPYLTALENVMLAQYFHSLADEQEAAEALRHVGLGERLQHLPSQLSGGEQQRVCVARALINQPNLVLADEPTGNLDEVNEAIVMGLFTELHRAGHTIVMVTHDPEIGRMAERRVELHHGRLADLSAFPAREEELVDDLLKAVWHAQEDTGKPVLALDAVPEFRANRATFLLMARDELVCLEDGTLALATRGEPRAREIIRRHRLAERLFFDTFGLEADLLEANACRIEHTLSAEVTEKLCRFLKHPQTCPHGSPIPRGVCCPR